VTDTPSPEPNAGRVPALDGIRGLAICLVMLQNVSWVMGINHTFVSKLYLSVAATGWSGVQVFFVLSGFLITGLLLDARGTARYFRDFYVRRTLRIFPLYYAFLAVVLLIVPLVVTLPTWTPVARANQVWYWTYTSNWVNAFGHEIPALPHFWSLAVEEQFYLFWPLVVFATGSRGLVRICLTTLAVTPFVRLGLRLAGLPALTAYEFTVARWDALAAGALLAVLLGDPAGRAWLRRRMDAIGAAGLVVLVLLALSLHGFHEDDLLVQTVGQSLIIVLAAWLIHAGVDPASRAGRTSRSAMSARWLRFLGRYSYAIYVFHFPIHTVASYYLGDAVRGADTPWRVVRTIAYLTGVALLSTLAALVSWHLLEKPCLDLRRRFAPTDSGELAARRRAGFSGG
jgi:peptidoglycan/LPS O-acetylase OafA/YrhL